MFYSFKDKRKSKKTHWVLNILHIQYDEYNWRFSYAFNNNDDDKKKHQHLNISTETLKILLHSLFLDFKTIIRFKGECMFLYSKSKVRNYRKYVAGIKIEEEIYEKNRI